MTSRTARSIRRGVAMAALTTVAAAATAPAAGFKSGTYKGHLTGRNKTIAITFKLAGRKVSAISLSAVPLYCQGGGPSPKVKLKSTTASATGRFTTTGVNVIVLGPFKGQVGERFTLKGTFKAHGKASGTLKTVYTKSASCSGSESFSAATA